MQRNSLALVQGQGAGTATGRVVLLGRAECWPACRSGGTRGGLEPVGGKVERPATGTSKSAVFRRFVAATETALAELLAAPLGELDLVALMVNQAGPASPNSPGF